MYWIGSAVVSEVHKFGVAFSVTTVTMRDFEKTFAFEPTSDQHKMFLGCRKCHGMEKSSNGPSCLWRCWF